MFRRYGWKRNWPVNVRFVDAPAGGDDNGGPTGAEEIPIGGFEIDFAKEAGITVPEAEEKPDGDNEEAVEVDSEVPAVEEETSDDKVPAPESEDTPADGDAEVESEATDLEAQLLALRTELEVLKGQQSAPQQPEAESSPKIDVNGKVDYFAGVDKDELIDDSEKLFSFFNDKLNEVRAQAVQHAFQSMPQMVSHYTVQQAAMREAVGNFYQNNPQLEGAKELVGQQVTAVGSAHPDWGMDQILNEVETRSYQLLGIKKAIDKKEKPKKQPAFAPQQKTRSKATPPKVKQMGDQMAEEIQSQVADFINN